MEGFWGILKRERYHGRHFTSRAAPVQMTCGHIASYTPPRLQLTLVVAPPTEVHARFHPRNRSSCREPVASSASGAHDDEANREADGRAIEDTAEERVKNRSGERV